MSVSEMYFVATGFAYIRGVDNYESAMPMSRFARLHHACLNTYGFKWVENFFIDFTLKAAAL